MAVAALPAIQQAFPPILPAMAAAPLPAAAPAASAGAAAAAAGADVFQVTAPMVGTFYRAPNPNAPPFVQVGDIVKKGQVICIIEAMKLMNEIESEVAGEVLESPVSNGQPVEYGEVLFRLRLTGS
jgi:acetyl-CoA carboxylase biotin carboxyl carrier protein